MPSEETRNLNPTREIGEIMRDIGCAICLHGFSSLFWGFAFATAKFWLQQAINIITNNDVPLDEHAYLATAIRTSNQLNVWGLRSEMYYFCAWFIIVLAQALLTQ